MTQNETSRFIIKLINLTKLNKLEWAPLSTCNDKLLPTIDDMFDPNRRTVASTFSQAAGPIVNKKSFYCKIDNGIIFLASKNGSNKYSDSSIFLYLQTDTSSYSKELANTVNSPNEIAILLKRLLNLIQYFDPQSESSFQSFIDSFLNEKM